MIIIKSPRAEQFEKKPKNKTKTNYIYMCMKMNVTKPRKN